MVLTRLRLYRFRNLEDQTLALSPAFNIIIGKNGQGKTNLLEAIAFLSIAKSFRNARPADLVAWGSEACSVFGDVENRDGDVSVGLSVEHASRSAYVNGSKVASVADFVGRLVTVTFSPRDLELVRGGPLERRSFIDKHLVDRQPALLREIVAYRKALKSKQITLKERPRDTAALDTWDTLLSSSACSILKARAEFITRLEQRALPIFSELSFGDGNLALRLVIRGFSDKAVPSPDEMREKFLQHRAQEQQRGLVLIGPHRDDMAVTLGTKPAKTFASQGQARSIVLALKLAVIQMLEEELQESPVILLDDVGSELDASRRRTLLDLIFSVRRQVVITATDAEVDMFRDIGAECCWYTVSAGQVVQSNKPLA